MTTTLSPAAAREIEAAIVDAIRTLVRVMQAAADKPDAPVPRALTQARLAATQVLRFAVRVLPCQRPSGRLVQAPDGDALTGVPSTPPSAITAPTPPSVPQRQTPRPPPTPRMRTAQNFLATAGSQSSLRRTG